MKFINAVNEQYLEKLKTEAIERSKNSAKEDLSMMILFIIGGIVLLIVSALLIFPTLFCKTIGDFMETVTLYYVEGNIFCKCLGGLIGLMGFLFLFIGVYCGFKDCRFLNKNLSDKEKEEIYEKDRYIRTYKSDLEDYNFLKNTTILKHDISMEEFPEYVEITFYYETEEHIVETKIIYADLKHHTKINEDALHLTEDGFVLYSPFKA